MDNTNPGMNLLKKTTKRFLLILLILLVIFQFFKPAKNISSGMSANAISQHYTVPKDVSDILVKACNDCHSNNSAYPWYNNIQPVAWWLNNHIQSGKRHLNFDEFATYKVAKQYKRMDDCIKEIKEGEMPMDSYTWIHKDAILTETDKQILFDWCNAVRDSIKARYPADSLVMKKK